MWILLVEDEKLLAHTLKRGLEDENHVVDVVFDGEEAELQGLVNDYDVGPARLEAAEKGRDGDSR